LKLSGIFDAIRRFVLSRYILFAAGGLSIAAMAGVGAIELLRIVPPGRWSRITIGLIALCAASVPFFLFLFYRHWFLLRTLRSPAPAGAPSLSEFHARFRRALAELETFPQLTRDGNDPVYALPWYLVLGGAESGKTTALRAVDDFSALLPPVREGSTQAWDPWFSDTMLAIDTTSRYTVRSDAVRDQREWFWLLDSIRRAHKLEPIAGAIITVAANEIASSSAEKLREAGDRMRECVREAIERLRCNFPLYILITKCDLIEGFQEFFSRFQPRILHDAVGYVTDYAASDGRKAFEADGPVKLRVALQQIFQRFHVLRLSILGAGAPEALKQPVFCFPQEFGVLADNLNTFGERLLEVRVNYHTPVFRGVFLSSAQQQATRFSSLRRELRIAEEPALAESRGQSYFLEDFFKTVLPRDRFLAARLQR